VTPGPRSVALTTVLVLASAVAGASPLDAGREKARACAVCHGPVGVSVQPDAPNLAGQPAIYLAAQMRAYRSGMRKHEVMAVISKALTDDDITQLAAWYSAIQVQATAPP
jgi:cytochrome c553